jgi:hypothetical protein
MGRSYMYCILREGLPPPRYTLGSAIMREFFLRNEGPSSSVFVCLLRLFSSSRFSGKTHAKLAVKNTIQI